MLASIGSNSLLLQVEESYVVTNKREDQPITLKRVTLALIPYLFLYQPFVFPTVIGLRSHRAWTCLDKLICLIQKGDDGKIPYQLLKTTLASAALVVTIFIYSIATVIATARDLTEEIVDLNTHLQNKEYIKARDTLDMADNSLTLAIFISGGLEIVITSLALKIFLGLYRGVEDFKKGKDLEAFAALGMVFIRSRKLAIKIG